MIERYATPEAKAIWTQENRFRIHLDVELLACEAMEKLGEVPEGTAQICRERAQFSEERIEELEKVLKHDVIAFLTNINEHIGEPGRHLHKGMTSSDVLDTALAVQLKEAGMLICGSLERVMAVLERRAWEHQSTICMGRSHGIHAEPVTFGWKLAIFWDELRRGRIRLKAAIRDIAVGKISGAVGTFAHLDPFVEAYVCEKLGLTPAPASSQIVQRDRHAAFFSTLALLAGSIEKIATEIRHLQRTEVLEAEEPFTPGQKGSSAMPHKRNPILSENLCGLARLVRGYALPAMEDVALWHERDISHSSVERVIGPDATITLHFMLVRLEKLVAGLVVYPENMKRNLERSGGLFYSQRVMLALVEQGCSREEAYARVQRSAMRTWGEGIPLLTLLKADPEVGGVLGEALDGLCSPDWYIRRAHEVLARVFARAPFKKVLFLCVANSARSQLAEALGRKYLGVEVFSAGSSPTRVNPYTLEVLEEIGLDASSQHSKAVHELDLSGIDLIVTLCAEEICPVGLTGVRRLHWPIPDPDLKDPSRSQEDFLKSFRATRENIRERILTLKENLG